MSILGIDAVNIQGGGGGLTHLAELIAHARPARYGFDEVLLFGGKSLDRISDHSWLNKIQLSSERIGPFQQVVWKKLSSKRRLGNCSLVFSPSATFDHRDIRYVSLPQNMLIFDKNESQRFPLGWTRARYRMLRSVQMRSLKNATGNIFLSKYAFETISRILPELRDKPHSIVHHGVDNRFVRPECDFESFSLKSKKQIELLYVSTINYYKHQWNVVNAVSRLRENGLNVKLQLVGAAHPPALRRLRQAMIGKEHFVTYTGPLDYKSLHHKYLDCDVFVFASTCENMPNILIEAMAAGLPIACSSYPPMPEFLKNCGVYFDPTCVNSIYQTVFQILDDSKLRFECSRNALLEARNYSWQNTADETFEFLRECLN